MRSGAFKAIKSHFSEKKNSDFGSVPGPVANIAMSTT
jgi:hypothetical protein